MARKTFDVEDAKSVLNNALYFLTRRGVKLNEWRMHPEAKKENAYTLLINTVEGAVSVPISYQRIKGFAEFLPLILDRVPTSEELYALAERVQEEEERKAAEQARLRELAQQESAEITSKKEELRDAKKALHQAASRLPKRPETIDKLDWFMSLTDDLKTVYMGLEGLREKVELRERELRELEHAKAAKDRELAREQAQDPEQ